MAKAATNYTLVKGSGPYHLAAQVEDWLRLGWAFVGGPFEASGDFYQAMVK